MRGYGVAAVSAALMLTGCATSPGGHAQLVRAAQRCADQTVQIYFEPWSADLTQEGRMVIDAAATNLHGCQVRSVDVLGLSDAAGAPDANLELSRRRAEAVSKALQAAGLPGTDLNLAAAGGAGAVTAAGQAKPLRRRVDVTLHVAPAAS